MCVPKYLGILPPPGCFQKLKPSNFASFCGSEWGFVMFFSSVGFLWIIHIFCWLGIWFTAQLWLHHPPILIKSFNLSKISFNLLIISLPSRYYRFIFLKLLFWAFCKARGNFVPRSRESVRALNCSCQPCSTQGGRAQPGKAGHGGSSGPPNSPPAAKDNFIHEKGECWLWGKCWELESCHSKWGRHNTLWRVSMPSWGMVKRFFWCQGEAEFAHPWVLSFGSKPENLLLLLICSKSAPCNGHTY